MTTSGLSAELLKQPISLDFRGENAEQGYNVTINTLGDWEVDPLKPYLGERWLSLVSGHAPWQMDIDLQLNDVGFTYQVDVLAQLSQLASEYPYPLGKKRGEKGKRSSKLLETKKVFRLVCRSQMRSTKRKSTFQAMSQY